MRTHTLPTRSKTQRPQRRRIVAAVLAAVGVVVGVAAPVHGTTVAGPSAGLKTTLGDVNHDGFSDAVSIRDRRPVLRLGNGNGTFGPPTVLRGFAESLEIGDLNGDSHLDVVMASPSDDVGVLFGDGSGAFGAPHYQRAGEDPNDVSLGDFDGDSRLDVLVSNGGNLGFLAGASVLLNSGQDRLDPPRSIGFCCPSAIEAVDVDGDRDLDAVALAGDHVTVARWERNEFTSVYEVPFGHDLTGLAVADVDRDGLPDVISAERNRWQVNVRLNRGGSSASGWGPTTAYDVGANPEDVAVADFDLDGNQDIVVAGNGIRSAVIVAVENRSSISFLYGRGGGRFDRALTTEQHDRDSHWRDVAVDDLNADIVPDVLVEDATYELVVLTQAPTRTAVWSTQNSSVLGDGVTFSAAVRSVAIPRPVTVGNVAFYDGASLLAEVPLDSMGRASVTTTSLQSGHRQITAQYVGATLHKPSAATMTQVVRPQSIVVSLSVSPLPAREGLPVDLTAVIRPRSPNAPAPSGRVRFYDDGVLLGEAAVSKDGRATLTTSSLAAGDHIFLARYRDRDDKYPTDSDAVTVTAGKCEC